MRSFTNDKLLLLLIKSVNLNTQALSMIQNNSKEGLDKIIEESKQLDIEAAKVLKSPL